MTLKGYHARLLAVMQNQLMLQQMTSMAVAMGVGSLFAESGMTEMQSGFQNATESIQDKIQEVFGYGSSDEGSDDVEEEVVVKRTKRAAQRKAELTERQRVRTIRKLDAAMSKITGSLVRNPAAQYQGEMDGPTPYDVTGTDTTTLINRAAEY